MSLRQNILLSSANKSVLYDLNNDITLNFPSNLFFKAPNFLELINFDLVCEVSLFGNTNNTFNILYKDELGFDRNYQIVVEYNSNIKTDYNLSQAIKNALNSINYENYNGLVFDVTESTITNVVTNMYTELDTSTTSYSIKSSKKVTISFDNKDSIGVLIGFGSGLYENVLEISGTSTQSISAYNFIDSFNESSDTGIYPNYNDINCKMCLYNSNGIYIPNIEDGKDSTISINSDGGLIKYNNIGHLLLAIENQMNNYSLNFTPAAKFRVIYDYNTNKVNIYNETSARFGIGFEFEKETTNVTSGSLHSVLGFEQKTYINNTSFISPKSSISFENVFSEDYILICSDLSNSSSDLNIIGIGAANNVKSNDILFAIPLSQVKNFTPADSSFYRANISNSPFAIGYKKKLFNIGNPNFVNFYLRTLSGRHVSATCQWSSLISFVF